MSGNRADGGVNGDVCRIDDDEPPSTGAPNWRKTSNRSRGPGVNGTGIPGTEFYRSAVAVEASTEVEQRLTTPVEKLFHRPIPTATLSLSQLSEKLQLPGSLRSPDNPLTARVLVNRVWQWHFGEGLVRTPNNFGSRSTASGSWNSSSSSSLFRTASGTH